VSEGNRSTVGVGLNAGETGVGATAPRDNGECPEPRRTGVTAMEDSRGDESLQARGIAPFRRAPSVEAAPLLVRGALLTYTSAQCRLARWRLVAVQCMADWPSWFHLRGTWVSYFAIGPEATRTLAKDLGAHFYTSILPSTMLQQYCQNVWAGRRADSCNGPHGHAMRIACGRLAKPSAKLNSSVVGVPRQGPDIQLHAFPSRLWRALIYGSLRHTPIDERRPPWPQRLGESYPPSDRDS